MMHFDLMSMPFYIVTGLLLKRMKDKLKNSDLLWTCLIGVCGYYLASLFDLIGLQTISASFERLILYLYPTMVLLISALLFKQKILLKEYLALAVGYSGIALIFVKDQSTQGDEVLVGSAFVLLSAFCFALFIIGSGRMAPKIGSARFTSIAMVSASLAIFCHFLLSNELSDLVVPTPVYWISLAIAIVCTVLPTYIMTAGIQIIGSNQSALVGAIGPASTMLLAFFILGEVLTGFHIVGMILVLFSVLSISVGKR